MHEPNAVDAYILSFSPEQQKNMNHVRSLVRSLCPQTEEVIKWGMPTFVWKKQNLVHFAQHKKHVGFYPGDEAIRVFQKELQDYEFSKGAIRFPSDQTMPDQLITKIVQYRMKMCSET